MNNFQSFGFRVALSKTSSTFNIWISSQVLMCWHKMVYLKNLNLIFLKKELTAPQKKFNPRVKVPLFNGPPKNNLLNPPRWVDVWMHKLTTYIVSCHGVVQLRGLVLGCPKEVPLRLWLVSLFYSMKVPLKLKKNPTGKQQSSLKVFHITSKYGRPNWRNI